MKFPNLPAPSQGVERAVKLTTDNSQIVYGQEARHKYITCRRRYCVLIFNFHFVVVYLICFYMWLRVLTSRKVAIYSNGDIFIIIVVIRFKFVVFFYVGCVGISLVVIPSLNVDGK